MRLEAITVRLPGPRRFVLGPLDVEGPDDRPWVILGPAGAGKSTLLRVLGGALRPNSGRITGVGAGEETGYLPQLPERALAGRNLAEDLCGEIRPTGEARAALRGALAAVGLAHLSLSRRSRTLSLGERRRLTLALLHLSARRHWALDEPDAGLDWEGRDQLAGWVASRPPSHRLWLATHRWELYRGSRPFILVLSRGKLLAMGESAQVLAQSIVLESLGLSQTGVPATPAPGTPDGGVTGQKHIVPPGSGAAALGDN
jgi:heme exporter protein A